MAGLSRTGYKRIPEPGDMTAQQAVSVYDTFYGRMPIPATMYALSDTPLRSIDDQPSVRNAASNASIVQRYNRTNGMRSTGGFAERREPTPQVLLPVDSSKFQSHLIGPQVDYVQNDCWYIAYPAATVMLGGQHNLKLSERTPQIPTRISGGPTAATMRQAPRFKAVQTVPRYSTMPPHYKTETTNG